jgi:UDP-glucose 4-epimerase
MILITGGLGFIGAHTARALLDLGESCLLTQHRASRAPAVLAAEIGDRVHIEQLDCTDRAAFLQLGQRREITGIVHLAATSSPGNDIIGDIAAHLQSLLNALDAAIRWGVPRVSIASTLGVYLGVSETPLREDAALPMTPVDRIPVLKKTAELIGSLVADSADVQVINLRIATVWGPLRRHNEPPFAALPTLIHGAAASSRTVYAESRRDLCYVKDVARGIALLQIAEHLTHRTYNVAAGHATSNAEIVAAITNALPHARLDLLPGRDPTDPGQHTYLDITRIHQDTGYQPQYDLARGITDYIEWLRAGHEY